MWAGKVWAQCEFVRVPRGRQTPPDLYWKAEFGFGETLAFYFPKTSYDLFGNHLKEQLPKPMSTEFPFGGSAAPHILKTLNKTVRKRKRLN